MFSSFLGRQRGKERRKRRKKNDKFQFELLLLAWLALLFRKLWKPENSIWYSIFYPVSLEGSAEMNFPAPMTTMLNRFRIKVYFSEIIIVVSCCCGACGWLRMNLMSSSEWARARVLKSFDHFLKMKNAQNEGKYLKRGWIFVSKYLRFPVQVQPEEEWKIFSENLIKFSKFSPALPLLLSGWG